MDLADFWHEVLEWCPKYWMHILWFEFSFLWKIQKWRFDGASGGPPYWRCATNADCRLADPRLADRRPADLQTCRLDKLAHSEICRPTFFVTSTGHVSSFLRAFQKPGHPSISRQNGWRWADFYLVDYIEVVVLRWRVLRDNRILLRILTER